MWLLCGHHHPASPEAFTAEPGHYMANGTTQDSSMS